MCCRLVGDVRLAQVTTCVPLREAYVLYCHCPSCMGIMRLEGDFGVCDSCADTRRLAPGQCLPPVKEALQRRSVERGMPAVDG